MKAIFVDVDGVLNNEAWADDVVRTDGYDPYDIDELCPHNLENLFNIWKATNPLVIISSSWRWDREALKALTTQFKHYHIPINGFTIMEPLTTLSREKEIALYLKQHPEITNYCILDDMPIEDSHMKPHHIKTTLRFGLTKEDTIKAIGVLMNE